MVERVQLPIWLQTDELLSQFSKQRKRAIEKYVDFVRAGVGLPSLWQDLTSQIYLGDKGFVNATQKNIDAYGKQIRGDK